MKRAIILLLACCLLLPACTAAESDTPKTETAGETVTSAELPTSTAVETTEETETTETAEITVTVETDAKSSHYEDMQMIYETLPLLGHLTRTTDYIYEYYTRFFAERHRKEPDEEYSLQ